MTNKSKSKKNTHNEKDLPDISNLPEDLQREIKEDPKLKKTLLRIEQYQGTFPHPDHMKQYYEMYPEAPKIIFDDFKKFGEAQRQQEANALNGMISFDKRAQWMGFTLSVILILSSLCCMYNGWEKIAVLFASVGMSPLIKSFFGSRNGSNSNNK